MQGFEVNNTEQPFTLLLMARNVTDFPLISGFSMVQMYNYWGIGTKSQKNYTNSNSLCLIIIVSFYPPLWKF